MFKHKSRLRTGTALVMAALFLFSLPAPALAAPDASKAVPWEEMEYEHYDPTDFKAQLKEMSAASEAGDADTALALYDALYNEYLHIYTLDSLCFLHNSFDVTDEYWADELVYSETTIQELGDALMTACHQMAEGPCADAFSAHVGQDAAEEFLDYEPMTARELELTARETELVNQYSAIMDTQDDVVYTCDGEDWTLERLSGDDAAALSPDQYSDILYSIFDTLAQEVVPIYQELVTIRTEVARLNGYDDYNHYVYEEIYPRSYTPEQADALFEEIHAICQSVTGSPVPYFTDIISPTYDTVEEMLDALREYTGRIDPMFEDTWKFMTENHLYDIAEGSGRSVGAFTIVLPAYGCPFIYGDETGSYYALSTLFHEFGHFNAAYQVPAENFLTCPSSLDLAEIHSTAMELLITEFYDEIFDQGADVARFCTLNDALAGVTDQALFAEFEARIYEQPEMTIEQLGQLYNDLSQEYGYPDIGRPDQTWITVPHFFESPDYVISYVAATLAALQIWAAAQEDFQTGVDIYMDIVRQGQYDLDYFQVLESSGLQGFDTAGVATEVCGQVLDALADMENDILGEDTQEPAVQEEAVPLLEAA